MNRDLLLRGGRVVDPASKLDGRGDIRIHKGVIAAVGQLGPEGSEQVIDLDGLVVAPGLVDVHVHAREPGQEWKETIGTATAAAAAGGFTTIFSMPNTDPPLDSVAALEEQRWRTDRDAVVRVYPIATISEGRRGERAVEFAALAAGGAVGFSDDGDATADSGIMRTALAASRELGVPVMVHCEDAGLIGGAMHEGDISRQLSIPGLAAAAEEVVIGRDLALAALTGGWLHICHVSTGRGVDLIREARRQGVNVTGEVMPHHLTMSDEWVTGRRQFWHGAGVAGPEGAAADPDTKVNPPLRTAADARRLLEALAGGEIDIVATDHAPHARPEKQGRPFSAAAFGLNGSEFALPLMLALVKLGKLSLSRLMETMSWTPARLWRLKAGALRPGWPADVVIYDPEETWVAEPRRLATRSANSPLAGMSLQGRVKLTFVGGDERYRDW